MNELAVTKASPHERQALENLLQLYTHDFSDNWAGTDRGDVDFYGRFAPYPLDPYWSDETYIPLMFRVAGHIAGFALLNTQGHTPIPVDWNIAEFFVLRKYRRGGIGTAAAHALFALRSGIWEAAVAQKNLPALRFWRSAVSRCPLCEDVQEHEMRDGDWNGPVLRFTVTSGRQ